MEGGTFQGKKFEKASHDYVFVFLHQTQPDSVASYNLVTEEYLEEEFLHPAYFFLRPDGTEADKKARFHHMALGAQQILKPLERIQKEWGRGLTEKEYAAALEKLSAAEALLAAEKWDEAKKVFVKLSRMRARCGLKDRAAAAIRTIELRRDLVETWRVSEGISEGLRKGVDAALACGDLAGAYRVLAKTSGTEAEASASFTKSVVAGLRETIRLQPIRLDRLFLSTGTYYYLRAEWETDLPAFDGLGLQISYLTDREKTLEGFGVFDEVVPHRHHRAAASLSSRMLRMAELTNVRAQLWIDGLLLHDEMWKATPAEFRKDESNVLTGPDLLTESETLGAGFHAKLRSYELGRWPGARDVTGR